MRKQTGSLELGPSLTAKVDASHHHKQRWLFLDLKRNDVVGGKAIMLNIKRSPQLVREGAGLFNSPPAGKTDQPVDICCP